MTVSGAWIRDLDTHLLRGKQVLLYGNVFDQQLINGRYNRFREALEAYFTGVGYKVIGHYDLVDGLTLQTPAARQLVDEIMSRALGGSPAASSATNVQPQRSMPRATVVDMSLFRPEQALDVIRHVLAQAEHPAAFIVDFSDKLTGDPDRFSEDERRWLVLLRKALDSAEFVRTGEAKGRRNALVTVAGQLAGVPAWFYKENPLVALVHVAQPSRHEREFFIRQFSKQFYGGTEPSDLAQEIVTEFADLTDGMTVWDLEGIRRASLHEKLSIARPKALVDYYRYGAVEDPWEQLDSAKIQSAASAIAVDVLGQDAAVAAVIDMLVAARVGLTLSDSSAKAGKPKGVFFFVGPTGVGKTELAKALSKLVFGEQDALDRYDMSEYAEKHAAEKLAGSPPGYVGYDEGGRLTNRMIKKPFSLLLFDEIEKADPLVMDKFLQILEDGRLTDAKGQTAYFSQSVIIFTSNIGSDTAMDCVPDDSGHPTYETLRTHYLNAVRQHFTHKIGRPELLNRFGDNILVFDMLRPAYIEGIAHKFLQKLAASAALRYGIAVTFEPSVLDAVRQWMQDGSNMQFGGRRIKTLLDATIVLALNRWVFVEKPKRDTAVRVAWKSGSVVIS
ncbi:MAG: AAA family ATPase [Thermoanaerobaculia bacterium]